MARAQMKYIIYKITNRVNNKVYIGFHGTSDVYDGYMGSGKLLNASIKKHGLDNFTKEVLFEYEMKQDALDKEREIVNEEFINRPDTYNIKLGGEGGWDHTWNSEKRKDAIRQSFKEGRSKGWNLSHDQRSRIGKKSFKGKTHSKEARKKIGNASRLKDEIFKLRKSDYLKIEKKRGHIGKLASMWNVSHTQVRRFIKDYDLLKS